MTRFAQKVMMMAMTRAQLEKLMEEAPGRHRRLLDRLLAEPAIRAEVHKPMRKTKKTAKAFTRTKVKVAAFG
jgi:hypothetical protein